MWNYSDCWCRQGYRSLYNIGGSNVMKYIFIFLAFFQGCAYVTGGTERCIEVAYPMNAQLLVDGVLVRDGQAVDNDSTWRQIEPGRGRLECHPLTSHVFTALRGESYVTDQVGVEMRTSAYVADLFLALVPGIGLVNAIIDVATGALRVPDHDLVSLRFP